MSLNLRFLRSFPFVPSYLMLHSFFFSFKYFLFYYINTVEVVQNAYPSTGITANSTLKVQSSPVGDDRTVFVSPCDQRITPGAHRRGDECYQGVPTCSISSPNVPVPHSIDNNGAKSWNTPETHCCGNESFQGDRLYVRTSPKESSPTEVSIPCFDTQKFPKKDKKILSKDQSSSITTLDKIHTDIFKKTQIENSNVVKKRSEYR